MIDLTEHAIFSNRETRLNRNEDQHPVDSMICWMNENEFLDIGGKNYCDEHENVLPFFKKEMRLSSERTAELGNAYNIQWSSTTSTFDEITLGRNDMGNITYNFRVNSTEWNQTSLTTSYTLMVNDSSFRITYSDNTSTRNSSAIIASPSFGDTVKDLWGCKTTDKNISEFVPMGQEKCKNPIPWKIVDDEAEASSYEVLPNGCPWLSDFYTARYMHGHNPHRYYISNKVADPNELKQYFKLIREGMELFDDDLFDLCMDEELIWIVQNGYTDDENPLPWESIASISRTENRNRDLCSYTEQMRWQIPWIVDMLRDIWRRTITKDLVDEYFSSEWYNIKNPELRKQWFSPPNNDDTLSQIDFSDDIFIDYINMIGNVSSSTAVIGA